MNVIELKHVRHVREKSMIQLDLSTMMAETRMKILLLQSPGSFSGSYSINRRLLVCSVMSLARIAFLYRILQEITPFEVGVRVNDDIQVRRTPRSVFFDPLDVALVSAFEDSVTGNVVSFLLYIFSDTF